ncbi:hypothetical protein BHM03_00016686 [Ensete ventricosum]|nr:hypothetical protein BHM03_00016686 [Ensete ventricosum]
MERRCEGNERSGGCEGGNQATKLEQRCSGAAATEEHRWSRMLGNPAQGLGRIEEVGKKIKREADVVADRTGRRLGLVGTLNTITPCAACKLLRRRCSQDCPFAPYFSPHEPQSLVYEADLRLRDPIYGCMGAISALHQQVQALEFELQAVRAEILKHKYRQASAGVIPTSHAALLAPSEEVSMAAPPPRPVSSPPPVLVNPPAVLPNLTAGAREGADVSHLYHGSCEVGVEAAGAVVVGLHLRVGGTAIVKLLIRVQETLHADEILVVVVVEGGRTAIDVGVGVNVRPEGDASCLANGWRTESESRATKSLVERPRSENLEMRLLSEELGGGMLLLAADKLAVVESLLPSFTFQLRPPSFRTSASISRRRDTRMIMGRGATLTKQSWKKRRRRDAPIRFSFEIADWTALLTVLKRSGQDDE